ncbi:MAG: hypothetical protein K2M44_04665 [Clostridia bacterium]|nr:hypothetical protein [Clostridia bacterium]
MAEINKEDISTVISSIIDAEKKADEIIAASLSEVKRIMSDAGAQATAIKDKAETSVKSEMVEALNNAGYVADSQCEIIKNELDDEKKRLLALSKTNAGEAVGLIVELIKENV